MTYALVYCNKRSYSNISCTYIYIYIYIFLQNHIDDYVLKWTDSKKIPMDNLKFIQVLKWTNTRKSQGIT